MHDPQDLLMLARFAVLGLLIVGIGLAGLLVHRKPLRFALAGALCLLGVLLLFEGAAEFHQQAVPHRLVSVVVLLAGGLTVPVVRGQCVVRGQSISTLRKRSPKTVADE